MKRIEDEEYMHDEAYGYLTGDDVNPLPRIAFRKTFR